MFLSQGLDLSVDPLRDSPDLVSDYQEPIGTSGERRQETGNEAQDRIRWIEELGYEDKTGPLPRCLTEMHAVLARQHAL
jgi:hypothetical protein